MFYSPEPVYLVYCSIISFYSSRFFFTLALADGHSQESCDSKSNQVSTSLLNILADLNIAMAWTNLEFSSDFQFRFKSNNYI